MAQRRPGASRATVSLRAKAPPRISSRRALRSDRIAGLVGPRQSQQAASDRHVVIRDAIQFSEATLSLPRLFENHRWPVPLAATALGAPLDDDAHDPVGCHQLDRDIAAAGQVAMEEAFSCAAFLGESVPPGGSLLHNASCPGSSNADERQ